MTRSALATRLARLEARHRRRPEPRAIVYGVFDATDADIVGVRVGGETFVRASDEAASGLYARAAARYPRHVQMTLYGPDIAAREEVHSPWRIEVDEAARREAEPLPEPPDPFALAGIGRRATREELERMGAIPFPPERLY